MIRKSSLGIRRFIDYLAHSSTPDDRKQVEAWAAEDPRRQKMLDNMGMVWSSLDQRTKPAVDLEGLIGRVEAHVAMHPAPTVSRHRAVALSSAPAWLIVVLVLVIGGIATKGWFLKTPQIEPAMIASVYETRTENGQQARVTLPDGSLVTLNVASRIEIPQAFGRNTRTVRLQGEAYFQVQSHIGTPFVVEANGTRTIVLGTAFSVRAYGRDAVRVVVRNGKVSVNNVATVAQEVAQVDALGDVSLARPQNVDAMLGFVNGRLMLDDVPLREAINDLSRWYNVDIQLTDSSLGEQRISANLVRGTVGNLIELLNVTFDARLVRQGHTVLVSPQ